MKYLLAVALICSLASPNLVRSQVHFNEDERRIITLTDERRDADSLLPYLTSSNPRVAWRAAIGLANIGDTTVRDALIARFREEQRDSVADAEAFALGMLGPNGIALDALLNSLFARPTTAKLKALAGAATKESGPTAAKVPGKMMEAEKIDHLSAAKAYVECALHKINTENPRMMDDAEILAGEDNPEIRWRAAFVFARAGDSLDMSHRLPRLKELLIDQGSAYARMFAATALGRLHNEAAEANLCRAFRGEQEWRVQINILNALAKFADLDSTIFATLTSAVMSARPDNTAASQIGLTAQSVIEMMVRAGKVSGPMLPKLRAWVDEFSAPENNMDVARIVQAAATPTAALLSTPHLRDAINAYGRSTIIQERVYSVRAMGSLNDTDYFSNFLSTMTYVSPLEQLWRLEALDSMWQRAKHNENFRLKLEHSHFANIYRYLLIRVSDQVQEPGVVTTAMEHVKDSSIVFDTLFRHEAERYLSTYLRSFCDPYHRDQLMSVVTAVGWMREPLTTFEKGLDIAMDSAQQWRDYELMDTIQSAYANCHITRAKRARLQRVSHIDWAYIENMPARMTINLEKGSVELKLLTNYAPLTVYRIVLLAKQQYFANQKIHRVVPNFVIQSGDPGGTGWGGPGYAMRSEFTPLEYDREGVVGMARDGKDTEGSQWFITECPTPHLDARYTIWGEVTGGISTVMKVLQGDKVETIVPYR